MVLFCGLVRWVPLTPDLLLLFFSSRFVELEMMLQHFLISRLNRPMMPWTPCSRQFAYRWHGDTIQQHRNDRA